MPNQSVGVNITFQTRVICLSL